MDPRRNVWILRPVKNNELYPSASSSVLAKGLKNLLTGGLRPALHQDSSMCTGNNVRAQVPLARLEQFELLLPKHWSWQDLMQCHNNSTVNDEETPLLLITGN